MRVHFGSRSNDNLSRLLKNSAGEGTASPVKAPGLQGRNLVL
jgi:hypothetical protein